jgi:hypothetical protein
MTAFWFFPLPGSNPRNLWALAAQPGNGQAEVQEKNNFSLLALFSS